MTASSSSPTRVKRGLLLLAVLAIAVQPLTASAQVNRDDGAPPGVAEPDQPAPDGGVPQGPKLAPKPGTPSTADKGAPENADPGETTPEQHAKLIDELYARLATAPDEATANKIAQAVEQMWQHSGSPTADLLLARASAAAEAQNRDLAMKLLNAVVELQPDFTEAWNRRAYLFYLDNDYKRALGDIRRVLALDPRHYKALEGLGNLLLQLGEKKAALEAYESVLKVHPNLPDAKKARDDLKVEIEGQGI